jgi:hypothetical protein
VCRRVRAISQDTVQKLAQPASAFPMRHVLSAHGLHAKPDWHFILTRPNKVPYINGCCGRPTQPGYMIPFMSAIFGSSRIKDFVSAERTSYRFYIKVGYRLM